MRAKPQALAIRRWGRIVCRRCVVDADEVAVVTDPETNARLMEEQKISVVTAGDLKGGEKCAMCGARIEETRA